MNHLDESLRRRGGRSMRHLMSTLIRIQFSPCYLDSKIPESCRGSGDISRLQDVIRLGNLDDCLMPQETTAKRSHNFYIDKCFVFTVYVRTSLCLTHVSSADLTFATAKQLILYIKKGISSIDLFSSR